MSSQKKKTAYLIMSGDRLGVTVSSKLRSPGSKSRSVKAAKRLGFTNAYAAKIMVNADCNLK